MAEMNSFDVEIFSVGTWNGDKYTEKDLDAMVASFSALGSEVKPPVKLGHNKEQMKDMYKDGHPAFGWVTSLKKVGTKLIATLSDVPDILKKAIEKGRYKRVSAEIYWKYKDTKGSIHDKVLAALSLLGTDIPAVTNLEDLTAYLSQSTDSESGSFVDLKAYVFSTDGNGEISIKKEKENKMPKTYTEEELQAKLKKNSEGKDDEIKSYKEAAKSYKEKLKKREETDAKNAETSSRKVFTDACVKFRDDGKMTPAQFKILEEGEHAYSSENGISISSEKFLKFIESAGKVIELKEKGEGTKSRSRSVEVGSAGLEVDKLAKEHRAANPTMDYASALTHVLTQNPELADRYADEDGEEEGDE